MKRIVVMFLFLLPALLLLAQQKMGKKEIRSIKNAIIEARVDSLLLSKNYTIVAQSAQPMGWQTVQLTSLYSLTVKGDSVDVNLPYYGRAYMVDYTSSEGGIKINADMEDYKIEQKRKQTIISFETHTRSDRYQFKISVSSSGYATIFVNCTNRQAITFNGILDHL